MRKLELGATLFFLGLFKKVVIADSFALVADRVCAVSPEILTSPIMWVDAIAYHLQIFFDFCGHSEMAIALGLMAPPEHDFVNRRRNMTYQDAHTLADFRGALQDRFIGKNLAIQISAALIELGLMTPLKGAIVHNGTVFYTEFFGGAPTSAYRGFYTSASAQIMRSNAASAGRYARDLQRCGITFVQIIHPTKEAALQLFAERGTYGEGATAAYLAASDPKVRAATIDLTDYLQRQAAHYVGDTHYRYGWHEARFGAHLAALEISRRLTELEIIPRPLEAGRFNAPRVTNRLFDQPEHLGRIVDDELSTMLWGARERPQWSYTPIPDGLFEGPKDHLPGRHSPHRRLEPERHDKPDGARDRRSVPVLYGPVF